MSRASTVAIWWVRRDFRLADNPALLAAVDAGEAVLPLFVLDPAILRRAGAVRTGWLRACLAALHADLVAGGGPGLSVVEGRPAQLVPQVARQLSAAQVHVSADFAPYGRRRDAAVAAALDDIGVDLVATGSPYGVAPGTLRTRSGSPFQVFTPYWRAWSDHGVHPPAEAVDPSTVRWLGLPDGAGSAADSPAGLGGADPGLVADAGERAARQHWRDWLDRNDAGVADYLDLHDLPGRDATSHLSIPLRWGQLHPRTVLADLAGRQSAGGSGLARQIAWRDFFADVLLHRPNAVTQPIRPEFAAMPTDDPDTDPQTAARLEAWRRGRTGYPLVDAGMRQLLAEGWMHNRVRLVTASFLVKDLHIGWWHGADWFLQRLRDADIAQNQLNWQWVAGCGTDAAPYFRVFNPTAQATKFDPDGSYIRRYVAELADLPLQHLHQPWTTPAGLPDGYPAPIVDHAAERAEALERYALVKS
ncbi:MAG TPA: deoxyribodipyrimidine photo-lyase [Propionibacteriaceae bacterium]|nr:deoxyribodipyrimidine photo-lyase [Propionibacteriaceae bacterium]